MEPLLMPASADVGHAVAGDAEPGSGRHSVPQLEEFARPDRLVREAAAGGDDLRDTAARGLHTPRPDTQEVLPRVPRLLREMRGFNAVCRHPAVELRVVGFPFACAHTRAAGLEGCEVSRRVCEPSKARNVLADRPHAQGRRAAAKRQPRCTIECAVSIQSDSHPLPFVRKTRRFRDGVLLTHTRPFFACRLSPAPLLSL